MGLVGCAIHCLQGYLVAHTLALPVTEAAACHSLQLLEVRDDSYIRQVRLLFDRSEESIPIQILILGSLVAEQYIDLSKS